MQRRLRGPPDRSQARRALGIATASAPPLARHASDCWPVQSAPVCTLLSPNSQLGLTTCSDLIMRIFSAVRAPLLPQERVARPRRRCPPWPARGVRPPPHVRHGNGRGGSGVRGRIRGVVRVRVRCDAPKCAGACASLWSLGCGGSRAVVFVALWWILLRASLKHELALAATSAAGRERSRRARSETAPAQGRSITWARAATVSAEPGGATDDEGLRHSQSEKNVRAPLLRLADSR